MIVNSRLSLEEFLTAPAEEIAQVVPATMLYAAGGTRRAAALQGIPSGDKYAYWSFSRMLKSSKLIFRFGVRCLIAAVGRPQIFTERGIVRDRFFDWMKWGLAGPESLDYYQSANWRVRLVVAGDPIPELTDIAATLEEATRAATGPNLWFLTTVDYDNLWSWIGKAFANGARTRAEAVRALFGADIPPAKLLLSFGKPLVALDHLPPLLYEEIQCYWTQRPGYSLTEHELRTILYDYAYLRPTWRQDKTGRAEEALLHRTAWEHGPTIGLGMRLGPFWYPAPIDPPT
ncbi:MAG: hypothetical protein JOZ78_21565 [Chroococcidiopsidaceae cyanobacterium CP_BM_ER_R8_30]|nr:hypothetical protein [Chroococcidiopsidaceae cyanobacterium CP_BM_ER_R8_30]